MRRDLRLLDASLPPPAEHGEVQVISAAIAREELATILSEVAFGKRRYVVERHGRGLVAIIPVEDLELLRRWAVARPRRDHPSDAV